MEPWFMTTIRSAISATTPKSCVMNITAVLCLVCNSRIDLESLLRGHVERVVGSSQISNFGFSTRAIEMTMRWRCPRDS